MKNQLDIIISAVIFVIALMVAGAFFAMKRQVVKPAPPTAPTLTAVKAPNPQPEMTNGLQLTTGSSNARGGGGGGFPGAAGFPGGGTGGRRGGGKGG